MAERGEFHSPDRARQLLRFDGIKYGNLTPTDIDFALDYHGKSWVFGEVKLIGNVFSQGQRIALNRKCEDAAANSRRAFCFFSWHYVYDVNEDVYIRDLKIVEYRTEAQLEDDNVWHMPREEITVLKAMDSFLKYERQETKKVWTAAEAIAAGDDAVADYVMGKI